MHWEMILEFSTFVSSFFHVLIVMQKKLSEHNLMENLWFRPH